MKMFRFRASILLVIFFHVLPPVLAQSGAENMLSLDGLVYGYNYDYSKKLLKKDKQIKVEGVLDGVTVSVAENGKTITSVKTNANGLFYVKLRTGKKYSLEFSKTGYSTVLMSVDLSEVTKELSSNGIHFSGAEILMNSFQSRSATTNPSIGKLFFNAGGNFLDFEENKDAPRKQKEYIENSASLMKHAVEKNKNALSNESATPSTPRPIKNEILPSQPEKMPVIRGTDSLGSLLKGMRKKKLAADGVNLGDIVAMESDLKNARTQFEIDKRNASTPEDSLRLRERELVLNAVEAELAGAKKVIELQESKISMQNLLLWLAIFFVLAMFALLLIIYRYNKDKKKNYLLLKQKNQKITDSINYASRIQNSILPSDAEIKKILPDSFVFFQPKDVVSGDFYWIREVNSKVVFACVDCTGHGVPGAFMSLIGNTILNEIVQEKQITEPSQILKHLHQGILKVLQQSTNQFQVEDGMDISLCVIDKNQHTLSFAGAMNPAYIVNGEEITILKPDIRSIGGMKQMKVDFEFAVHTTKLSKATSVYLFTDGYMDQFGGPENKKFNIPNFKKMVIEMQGRSMEDQGKVIARTIQDWQGSGRQIDDMLVAGFRI